MKPLSSLLPATPALPMEEPAQPSRAVARQRTALPALPRDAAVDVVAGVRLPKSSRALDLALRDAENPHPDVGRNTYLADDAVRIEARRQLAYVRQALEVMPTVREWAAWLLPLVAELQKSPAPDDFPDAVERVNRYVDDVPLAVLTFETQKRAIKTMRFWPQKSELEAFFAPDVAKLKARARHLAEVARPPREEQPAITPVEREAVLRQMEALAAEQNARAIAEETAGRPPLRPSLLKGEHLRAWREKQRAQTARFTGPPQTGGDGA